MSADLELAAGSEDLNAAHNPEPAPASSAHMPGSHMPGAYDPGGQANGNGAPPAGATSEGAPGGDVLDVEGVTRLLRIGRNTIYELVGRNEIPHRRLGKQIRFSRAAIMRWLDSWSLQGAKERR
jgi:excisionase family DNA binding protein